MAKHLLFEAVRKNNLNRVKFLIESYVATNADISEKNDLGWTALHIASEKGHLKVVKFLVNMGSNISEKTNSGVTAFDLALNFASKKRDFEIAKFLRQSYIDAGVGVDIDIDIANDNGGVTAIDVDKRE